MSAQIKQKTSHIEFEVYFPPQLNMENTKNSLDVEGPHHYNNFFWECTGQNKNCLWRFTSVYMMIISQGNFPLVRFYIPHVTKTWIDCQVPVWNGSVSQWISKWCEGHLKKSVCHENILQIDCSSWNNASCVSCLLKDMELVLSIGCLWPSFLYLFLQIFHGLLKVKLDEAIMVMP